jgi:hypothetical protein
MPVINIEENITQLRVKLEQMTQEMFRVQGVLQTFEGFKKGGLETIDLPTDPNQSSTIKELKSTQEKPE